jgi:hypothetical protein
MNASDIGAKYFIKVLASFKNGQNYMVHKAAQTAQGEPLNRSSSQSDPNQPFVKFARIVDFFLCGLWVLSKRNMFDDSCVGFSVASWFGLALVK